MESIGIAMFRKYNLPHQYYMFISTLAFIIVYFNHLLLPCFLISSLQTKTVSSLLLSIQTLAQASVPQEYGRPLPTSHGHSLVSLVVEPLSFRPV